MACKYKYKGKDYTKDEFYSLVRTTMVKPRTVQKYNKILFPTGNTASKVEGHTTLEEFKKQKEDRIKELENGKTLTGFVAEIYGEDGHEFRKFESEQELNGFLQRNSGWEILDKTQDFDREINQLKQELKRVETEGFGALKPIYNFYETTVKNILKKTYGKIQDYSNTSVKEGVNSLFENNKELKQIGNEKLYSAYLDTIFPDSKVKDIVYHGTDAEFDKFNKELSGNKTGWAKDNKGIHFVNNKIAAETYIKSKEDGYGYLALWIYLKKDAKSGKSLTKEEFNNILLDNTKLVNTLEGAHYFSAIDIDNITFQT